MRQNPRYVDPARCIGCGDCVRVCPVEVSPPYPLSSLRRRAILIESPQAVPNSYRIDGDHCLKLARPGSCGRCLEACAAGAIHFDMEPEQFTLQVGAVILATGSTPFNPAGSRMWGFGRYANVITSIQLEHHLAVAGAAKKPPVRPGDGQPIHNLGFLLCVGSRDKNNCDNEYCSSVCCMVAIKEAMVIREQLPGVTISIFYLDLRAHEKDAERYVTRAEEDAKIRFIRARVHGIEPTGTNGDLRLHYLNDQGCQCEEIFDLVVLSVGLETPRSAIRLAETLDVHLTSDRFASTSSFLPVLSSRSGIFTCGGLTGPKDISMAVTEGSAAAAGVAEILAETRHSLTADPAILPEIDVTGQPVRFGIFLCHCGSNISRVIDIAMVARDAATIAGVIHVEQNLFGCSPDTQKQIQKVIREKRLNRIVIAACSPHSHGPLFRETIRGAGLNESLFEMANIRNQNSWVHGSDPRQATAKASEQINMAVARLRLSVPVQPGTVPVIPTALIIGGGLAGMTAALNLARQGFTVCLVERTDVLGGNAQFLHQTWNGEDIPVFLSQLIDQVASHPRIRILFKSRVVNSDGHAGNFRTTLQRGQQTETIQHGVTLLTTGGKRFIPKEYGYGRYPGVFTSLEFDKIYQYGDTRVRRGNSFLFIQCVGSRDDEHPYCSKVCCTHSVQSAIRLKKEDPGRRVYILHRDIRTYSRREALYSTARQLGIIFIRYDLQTKPMVSKADEVMRVAVRDHILHRPLVIEVDIVILAVAILPNTEAHEVARLFNLDVNEDGFFQEAHPKLRPVDFNSVGVFVAGLAHYPKPIEESISQALAAAARAATLLSQKELDLDGLKAVVVDERCDGCALCLDVCPYQAITLVEKTNSAGEPTKSVLVDTVHCCGCGLCQGTCPIRGIYVAGFSPEQLSAELSATINQ